MVGAARITIRTRPTSPSSTKPSMIWPQSGPASHAEKSESPSGCGLRRMLTGALPSDTNDTSTSIEPSSSSPPQSSASAASAGFVSNCPDFAVEYVCDQDRRQELEKMHVGTGIRNYNAECPPARDDAQLLLIGIKQREARRRVQRKVNAMIASWQAPADPEAHGSG